MAIDANVFIKKAFNFAKKYHGKDNTGHDFAHIMRVYENVCLLLKEVKKVDAFVVKMAAILHDVDDRKLNFGEKQVGKFLQKIKVPEEKSKQILETIYAIDFGTTGSSPNFDTLEKAVLFDADKLDAIGSIGICRTIMYGNSKSMKLFDADIFPKKNLTKEEYRKLNRKDYTTINHFFDKLLKLSAIMQTKSGKKEAAKRQKIMVQFLTEFFREQGQARWIAFLNGFLKKI